MLKKSNRHGQRLTLALGWWLAATTATTVFAQTNAPVLSSTPVYDVQLVPHEICTPIQAHGATRCTTQMVREEQLLGFDVRYSYQGQQFVQRMPYDPGRHIAISTPSPAHSYSSTPPGAQRSAQPAQKSYGSAPAGAAQPDVIEYRHLADTPPAYIEMQLGRSAPPARPLPHPAHGHPPSAHR